MKIRIVILIAILAIFLLASRNMVIDDGLIYARFFQNALTGKGLVFNPGESVNALTSPLFSYLMLGVAWLLHGHVLFAEHVVFGLGLLGACVLAESFVPYSGIAIASTAYFYAIIGLESTIFLFLIMLVVKAYVDRRYDWLPLLLVLTLLTRFEGGLLIPIIAYLLWRNRKFPRLISILPALVVVLTYVLLNHHLYHAFLPHSASSKFGQAHSGYWGRWPTGFLRIQNWAFLEPKAAFLRTIYVVPLIVYFGFKGWRQLRGKRINDVIAPLWLGLALFYVLFNMPAYKWYYAPLIFVSILYAIRGVPQTRNATVTLFAVLLVAGVTNVFLVNSFSPDWDYVNIANWINANTPEDASIESVEIGQIGWYAHRHVIDILGLTYPKNADHIAHDDASSWLAEDHPDYIVIHKPAFLWEAVVVSNPNYEELPYHSAKIHLLRRKTDLWLPSKP
jgi:hypothetical protein